MFWCLFFRVCLYKANARSLGYFETMWYFGEPLSVIDGGDLSPAWPRGLTGGPLPVETLSPSAALPSWGGGSNPILQTREPSLVTGCGLVKISHGFKVAEPGVCTHSVGPFSPTHFPHQRWVAYIEPLRNLDQGFSVLALLTFWAG